MLNIAKEPLVSILWVNYNSKRIINIVKKSLKSIKDLQYNNYELIIVDNASTDGSYEIIKDYVNSIGLKAKIIRNRRNLGFTGGNNVAYLARDPNSKYVVLLNNDAIVYPDSLSRMVQAMESDPRCGALQGIILWLSKNSVYSAGSGIDEFMFSNIIMRNTIMQLSSNRNNDYYVSYSDGCYSIYRTKAIEKLGKAPFIWSMFAYFDDSILGIRLWNAGYTVKCIPHITAKHLWRGTFRITGSGWAYYYWIKGWMASLIISNSKQKSLPTFTVLIIRLLLKYLLTGLKLEFKPFVLGLRDGIRAGYYLRKNGFTLDIYKIPLVKRNKSVIRATPLYFIIRKFLKHLSITTPKDLYFYNVGE
ncbi:MAG: glycosyltransferase family 2 protein [Thermoprotei archaeon]